MARGWRIALEIGDDFIAGWVWGMLQQQPKVSQDPKDFCLGWEVTANLSMAIKDDLRIFLKEGAIRIAREEIKS